MVHDPSGTSELQPAEGVLVDEVQGGCMVVECVWAGLLGCMLGYVLRCEVPGEWRGGQQQDAVAEATPGPCTCILCAWWTLMDTGVLLAWVGKGLDAQKRGWWREDMLLDEV